MGLLYGFGGSSFANRLPSSRYAQTRGRLANSAGRPVRGLLRAYCSQV